MTKTLALSGPLARITLRHKALAQGLAEGRSLKVLCEELDFELSSAERLILTPVFQLLLPPTRD